MLTRSTMAWTTGRGRHSVARIAAVGAVIVFGLMATDATGGVAAAVAAADGAVAPVSRDGAPLSAVAAAPGAPMTTDTTGGVAPAPAAAAVATMLAFVMATPENRRTSDT